MDVAKDDPTETQYILITPQGIENVKGSADVHISRMVSMTVAEECEMVTDHWIF